MSGAYRDDLAAARARVSDLEREAERLRARNAELTAIHGDKVEPREPAERPAEPAPSAVDKVFTALARICVVIALVAVCPPKYPTPSYTPHFGVAAIFAPLGLLFWCCSGCQPLWGRRR